MSDIEINELETLKQRLDLMGVKYHHNAGVEKLRTLLADALSNESPIADEIVGDTDEKETKPVKEEDKPENDPRALIRVFISCHNPAKQNYKGEIFSIGNARVGTLKKYVAFNEEWHIPRIIFDYMKEKQFQQFYTEKDGNGNKIRKSRLVREFNIEVLPQLNEQELKELAQRQAMAAGTAKAL